MADDGAHPYVDEHSDASESVTARIDRFCSELDLLAIFRAEGRTSYVEADDDGNVITRHLTH